MSTHRRVLALSCAVLGAASTLMGCNSGPAGTTLTVSAASSLTEAMSEIGQRFEATHPGVSVRFNFGGSSALAEQIASGAPVDVFASASLSALQAAIDRLEAPESMATNRMAVAVPASNPAGISSLDDLARPGVTVVLCQESVPCGAAAASVLDNAGLTITPASLEPDVKSVLAKVSADEADAGIVYSTDITAAAADAREIEIPADVNVTTTCVIAAVRDSAEAPLAAEFIQFVLGEQGREVLLAAGFGPS